MSKDQTSMSEELFKIDGKPSTSQALPLALQHVVAMVVGCVAPAIIISGVAGLSASDSVILIQAIDRCLQILQDRRVALASKAKRRG